MNRRSKTKDEYQGEPAVHWLNTVCLSQLIDGGSQLAVPLRDGITGIMGC